MNNIIFFTKPDQLSEALSYFDLTSFSGKQVPLKLHMGEIKNPHFLKSEYVKQVADTLQDNGITPFLFDTTVAYPGLRSTKKGYLNLARLHGFSRRKLGYDVIIGDVGIDVSHNGHTFEVATQLYQAGHIVALTHCKGHIQVGFGGAIKNFGMGGVTRETKKQIHRGSEPVYTKDGCTFCGVCAEVCPFNAITVTDKSWKRSTRKCFGCGVCVDKCTGDALRYRDADLQYLLAVAAQAVLQGKHVLYINELLRMARSCDCDPRPGPAIVPDIGYLVGIDPVAIDNASLDLIHDIKPDVFEKTNGMDPYKQIKYGEEIGLGSSSYNLIEL